MITYTDKVQLTPNPNPDVNQWRAVDANEVKNEVNANITATNNKQPLNADLTAIAALSPSNDDIIQRKAGAWTNRTLSQLSADLGLDNATIVTITGTTVLDATAFGKIHILIGTTTDYTVTLPTAAAQTGKSIAIKGSAAFTKVATIACDGSETIDSYTTRKIAEHGLFVLMSDGTNWVLVNEVGSWIPWTTTYGGFLVDPAGTPEFFRVGKNVTLRVAPTGFGTSNATTFTMTAPFNAEATQYFPFFGFNNGAGVLGRVQITGGATTLTLTINAAGGAWTSSGNKNAYLNITYKIE